MKKGLFSTVLLICAAAFMEQKAPEFSTLNTADDHDAVEALGLKQRNVVLAASAIVNTGNAFLILKVKDEETL